MSEKKTLKPFIVARCWSCGHIVAVTLDTKRPEDDRDVMEWIRRGDVVSRLDRYQVTAEGCRQSCKRKKAEN